MLHKKWSSYPQTDVIYVAFEESFLQQKMQEWQKDKAIAKRLLNEFMFYLAGFIVSFVYLIIVIGRTSFKDKELHLHVMDKLYNDLNIVIVVCLISMWMAMIIEVLRKMNLLLTVPIFIIALLLVLSLVKHIKNRTLLQHALI
ncbi:histidine kinase OS=Lysinibacillus sphaericus OX=1421 GN=LS41612_02760 PE=4 SV=1 [Lysinibacillus sphaericus]